MTMAIKLIHANIFGTLGEERLARFEKALRTTLPDEYRSFLLNHNGGRPSKPLFTAPGAPQGATVEWFFALHDQPYDPDDERPVKRGVPAYFKQPLQDVLRDFRSEQPRSRFVPIARDSAGNLVCIGLSGNDRGKIAFYDHELESLETICNSFGDFVAGRFGAPSTPKNAAPVKVGWYTESYDADVPVTVLSGSKARGSSTFAPKVCPACGKYDALACLEAGSASSVDPARVRVDYGFSHDNQLLVSKRVLDVFRSVLGTNARAYPIGPSRNASHFVVYPTSVIDLPSVIPKAKPGRFPDNAPFRSHGPKCKVCGHYGDVTFNLEWMPIPLDTIFAGLTLSREGSAGILVRVFNSTLADALKSAGIPKFRVAPIENRSS